MELHLDLLSDISGWKMAGAGGFREVGDGVVESFGGSGLLWYAGAIFEDFRLTVEWRLTNDDDNSGVFVRCPPLVDDPGPAIQHGYEVQIDDRGYDPERQALASPLHLTGAIYRLAPASRLLSNPTGQWNTFDVTVSGGTIAVLLNGQPASRLEPALRSPRGHIALQAHHEGSAVRFRNLRVRPL